LLTYDHVYDAGAEDEAPCDKPEPIAPTLENAFAFCPEFWIFTEILYRSIELNQYKGPDS